MEEIKTRLIALLGRKIFGFLFISGMVIATACSEPMREFYKFTMEIWVIAFGVFAGVSTYQKLKMNGK